MREVWKPVPGYDGLYEISNHGKVKSLERKMPYQNSFRAVPERILKTNIINGGYVQVTLQKGRRRKSLLVHRLVAESFIQNPQNLPQVNHIDGNKLNNRSDNLEWCTAKENISHALENRLRSAAAPVDMLSINGVLLRTFRSAREAEKQTGINHVHIYCCCSGKRNRKTAGGYVWKYHSGGETNECA